MQESPPNIRIDLSEVSFLDSSAVGVLVTARRNVERYGGNFSLRSGSQGFSALERRGLLDYFAVESAR